jgi:hypothetical protein
MTCRRNKQLTEDGGDQTLFARIDEAAKGA